MIAHVEERVAFQMPGAPQAVRGDADDSLLSRLPRPPRVSLANLALYFSQPVLELDFTPASPWAGVELVRPPITVQPGSSDPGGLTDRFRESVRGCMADAETIAVAFSGGLDSLAVLWHADQICRAEQRKLIVTTIDLTDDEGRSAAAEALRLIEVLDIQCDAHRIDADPSAHPEPAWNAAGPNLSGTPRLNRAASDLARERGAGVLLTGVGGDELLLATDYSAWVLLQRTRFRDLIRYLRDVGDGDGIRLVQEVVAVVAGLLPERLSFQLYLSASWGALSLLAPPQVLAERWREHVRAWSVRWLRDRLEAFVACGKTWSLVDLEWRVYGFQGTARSGEIPERSPFLEPSFAGYALSLPQETLYSRRGGSSYHRFKARTVALLPASFRQTLPRTKQTFDRALATYAAKTFPGRSPFLGELGVIDTPVEWPMADARIPHLVGALDRWVTQARDEVGAVFVGECDE